MSDKILQEQLNYYRARAQEYDESIQQVGRFATEAPHSPEAAEFEQAANALRALAPLGNVLELAAGTGVWTTVLAPISASLTVIDGSPEMLAINESKIGDSAVRYECVDLFNWEPTSTYDLVVFGFWLSHVPPDKLDTFLDKVKQAVKPGGRVFIIDEPANGKQLSGPNEDGQYQTRTLYDGRTFGIIKVYYDPATIQYELERRGFKHASSTTGEYVFYLSSIKGKQDH
jgi:2-polyprenyl-3-methyl-5-hydroxy-6-metoxy-1,4-benzoquinol methylase